jgi:hypothetical protein
MNKAATWSISAMLALGLTAGAVGQASAGSTIEVQVGYADGLRPSPFFPNPWQGSSGIALFAGFGSGGPMDFDAGAIRVINNGSSAITITNLVVDGFGDGASYSLWGSFLGAGFSLDPGKSAIFTQTSSYNFDTSDDQGNGPSTAIPVVHLTIDGTTSNLSDTAQVLNTEGTDHLGASNLNESHQWRDIGTFGGQPGVPEPSTIVMAGTSSLLLIGWSLMTRRQKHAKNAS